MLGIQGLDYNGYVYETFGISKQFPVKLQLLLIRAGTLRKTLTAKCFIHDVVYWTLFTNSALQSLTLSIEALLFPKKFVFRVGKKAMADRQALLQFLVACWLVGIANVLGSAGWLFS